MDEITLYHNPQCSKSRQALEILANKGFKPTLVEYLKTPLSLEHLQQLRSNFLLKDFVRVDEAVFTELNLTLDDEVEVLHAMLMHPILMQRPIVAYQNKAIIGRPPEKVLELFSSL